MANTKFSIALIAAALATASLSQACAQTHPVAKPAPQVESADTPAKTVTYTAIEDIERGTSVNVKGTIERILDEDEFRLADETGTIRVYIGPNLVPANVGDQVSVSGIVDNDLRREIYARNMTLPDGSVVTFDRRYD